ncbi:Hypothetical protein PBC10988_10020 [Planctomycetales bacterium 10988]|nr:Hypothetical protein PBC10988_10020 [Planctomycetales bacterium 10988]
MIRVFSGHPADSGLLDGIEGTALLQIGDYYVHPYAVYVASVDIDEDGHAEIITATQQNGAANNTEIRVYRWDANSSQMVQWGSDFILSDHKDTRIAATDFISHVQDGNGNEIRHRTPELILSSTTLDSSTQEESSNVFVYEFVLDGFDDEEINFLNNVTGTLSASSDFLHPYSFLDNDSLGPTGAIDVGGNYYDSPNVGPQVSFPEDYLSNGYPVVEDTETLLTGITITDPDALPGDTFKVTLEVSRGVIFTDTKSPGNQITYAAETLDAINQDLATLRYTPDPDVTTEDVLTVELIDLDSNGYGQIFRSDSIALSIIPVNDSPLFTINAPVDSSTGRYLIEVDEDAGEQTIENFVTIDSWGNEYESDQVATAILNVLSGDINLFSTPPEIIFETVDGITTGDLVFTAASDVSGTFQFKIEIEDEGEGGTSPLSDSEYFDIVLNAVADAPNLSPASASLDLAINQEVPLPVASSLVDSSETLEIHISGFPANSVFSIGTLQADDTWLITSLDEGFSEHELESGELTFTPPEGHAGVITLSISATSKEPSNDDEAVVNSTITLNYFNHQPSFVASDITIDEEAEENTTVTISNWATFDPGAESEVSQTPTYLVNIPPNSILNEVDGIVVDSEGNLHIKPLAHAFGEVTFEVTVVDSGGSINSGNDTSDSQTFTLNLTPVNNAPTFDLLTDSTSGILTLHEDEVTPNEEVYRVENFLQNLDLGPYENDLQNFTIEVEVLTGSTVTFSTPPEIDEIDLGGGETQYDLVFRTQDNEHGVAQIRVSVTDDNYFNDAPLTTFKDFTIQVHSVNDPPELTASNPPSSLEDGGVQEIQGWAQAEPGPSNEDAQSISYTLTVLSGSELLQSIDLYENGTLTYQSVADAFGEVTFEVTVEDDGGTDNGGINTFTQQFSFEITPVNDVPVLTSNDGPFSLDEGSELSLSGFVLGDVDDVNGSELEYEMTVSVQSGILTLPASPNYDFPLAVIDTPSPSLTFSGTLPELEAALNNLTYQPTDYFSGTDALTVTISDPGEINTTALLGVELADLSITVNPVADAPNLSLASSSLDLAVNQTVPLPVASSLVDTDGSESLEITITGVPIGASFLMGSEVTPGTWRIDSQHLDLDQQLESDELIFTPPTDFAGTIELAFVAKSMDGESNPVEATSDTLVLTLTYHDNQQPILNYNPISPILEDLSSAIDGFTFEDADSVYGTTEYTLTFQVSQGMLTLTTNNGLNFDQGEVNEPSQMIEIRGDLAAIQGALENLEYLGEPDFSGEVTLGITIHDPGIAGTNPPTTYTFHSDVPLTVEGVADAPFLTKLVPYSQHLVNTLAALSFTSMLKNASVGAESLEIHITGFPENSSFSMGTEITPGTWVIDSSDPNFANNALEMGELLFTPPADYLGELTLYVTARAVEPSGTSEAFSNTTSIVLNFYTNHRPTFVANDVTIDEVADNNQEIVIANWAQFYPGASYENYQTPTYSLEITSNSELLEANGLRIDDQGSLHIKPLSHTIGTVGFQVSVNDGGGNDAGGDETSVPQVFSLEIAPVNDPPSFVLKTDSTNEELIIDEDEVSSELEYYRDEDFLQIDEDTSDISYSVEVVAVGEDATLTFLEAPRIEVVDLGVDGTRYDLIFRTLPNDFGFAKFQVLVADDDQVDGTPATGSREFTIVVNPVNDAPRFVAADPNPVREDSTTEVITIAGWANFYPGPFNESDQTLHSGNGYSVTILSGSELLSQPISVDEEGNLSYQLAPNAHGEVEFEVTVQDDGGTANGGVDVATQTYKLRILPQNDAPIFVNQATVQFDEDSGAVTITDFLSQIDSGELLSTDQDYTVEVDFEDFLDRDFFEVAPEITLTETNGVITGGDLTFTPKANRHGEFNFSVTLTDDYSIDGIPQSTTQFFTIQLLSVDDPATLTVPTSITTQEDTATIVGGIVLSDLDDLEQVRTLELEAGHGTLTFTQTEGLTFRQGDGVEDSYIEVDGTLADLQAALTTLRYQGGANNANADTITLTLTEPADVSGEVVQTIPVTIEAVADTPNLTVPAVVVGELGDDFHLNIIASLKDGDGSENLKVIIEGVPDGLSLSAGTKQADGTWHLAAGDLVDLSLTVPSDWKVTSDPDDYEDPAEKDFTLTVYATATEGLNGPQATTEHFELGIEVETPPWALGYLTRYVQAGDTAEKTMDLRGGFADEETRQDNLEFEEVIFDSNFFDYARVSSANPHFLEYKLLTTAAGPSTLTIEAQDEYGFTTTTELTIVAYSSTVSSSLQINSFELDHHHSVDGNGDFVTSDPTIKGLVQFNSSPQVAWIDLDYGNDGIVDYTILTASDGTFEHLNEGLSSGIIEVKARARYLTGSVWYESSWETLSFIYEREIAPAIDSFSVLEVSGEPSEDENTYKATLVGQLDVVDDPETEKTYLVEIDLDQDDVAETTLVTNELGEFTWSPELEPGTYTVQARSLEWDSIDNDEDHSVWQTLSFELLDGSPTVNNFLLQNDDGTAGDSITTDPTVSGTVTSPLQESNENLFVEIDLDGDQVSDELVLVDSNYSFAFLPFLPSDGTVTINARAVSVEYGAGEWETLTFEYEYPGSELLAITDFELANDTNEYRANESNPYDYDIDYDIDTGEITYDEITYDPTLKGQIVEDDGNPLSAVELSFTRIEIEIYGKDDTGDHTILLAEYISTPDDEGNFTVLPQDILGEVKVKARAAKWDLLQQDYVGGTWEELTIEIIPPPLTNFLVRDLSLVEITEESPENEPPVSRNVTLQGSIPNYTDDQTVTVEFEWSGADVGGGSDYHSEVVVDGSGEFTFKPNLIGTISKTTIYYRTYILIEGEDTPDPNDDKKHYSSWRSYEFQRFIPPITPVPQVASLGEAFPYTDLEGNVYTSTAAIVGTVDLSKIEPEWHPHVEVRLDYTLSGDDSSTILYLDVDEAGIFSHTFEDMQNVYGEYTVAVKVAIYNKEAEHLVTDWYGEDTNREFSEATYLTFHYIDPTESEQVQVTDLELIEPVDEAGEPTFAIPTIQGSLVNDGPVAGLTIEVDYQIDYLRGGNGDLILDGEGNPQPIFSVDDTFQANQDGTFEFRPETLAYGEHTVAFRAIEVEGELTEGNLIFSDRAGEWVSFTFNYEAPPQLLIDFTNFFLLNDPEAGQGATPTIADPVLQFNFDGAEDYSDVTIHLEYKKQGGTLIGETSISGNSEEILYYRPTDLPEGEQITITAQMEYWDERYQLTRSSGPLTTSLNYQPNSISQPELKDVEITAGQLPTIRGRVVHPSNSQNLSVILSYESGTDGNGIPIDPQPFTQVEIPVDEFGFFTYQTNLFEEGSYNFSVTAKFVAEDFSVLLGDSLLKENHLVYDLSTIPVLETVELKRPEDGQVAYDPALIGQVDLGAQSAADVLVQFDFDGDNVPDATTTVDSTGAFEFLPEVLAENTSLEISARLVWLEVESDEAPYVADLTISPFTLLPTPILDSLALKEDTGVSNSDSITSQATISGTILLPATFSQNVIVVEIDTNFDGQLDTSLELSTENLADPSLLSFEWTPTAGSDGLANGLNIYHFRTRFDVTSESSYLGNWQSIGFIFGASDEKLADLEEINGLHFGQDSTLDAFLDITLEGLTSAEETYSDAIADAEESYQQAISTADSDIEATIEAAYREYLDLVTEADELYQTNVNAAHTAFQTALSSYTGDTTDYHLGDFVWGGGPDELPFDPELLPSPSAPSRPSFLALGEILEDEEFWRELEEDPLYQAQINNIWGAYISALSDARSDFSSDLLSIENGHTQNLNAIYSQMNDDIAAARDIYDAAIAAISAMDPQILRQSMMKSLLYKPRLTIFCKRLKSCPLTMKLTIIMTRPLKMQMVHMMQL